MGALKEHNEKAAAQTERTERHYTTVLDHLIGSQSTTYRAMAEKLRRRRPGMPMRGKRYGWRVGHSMR